MVCGILFLLPGIKSQALAMKAQSPNHWIAREFLSVLCVCVIKNFNQESKINWTSKIRYDEQ